jgi:hypothetical protein
MMYLAWKVLRDLLVDTGFLCDKTAELTDKMKGVNYDFLYKQKSLVFLILQTYTSAFW